MNSLSSSLCEPTFPKWHAVGREDRLNPTNGQAFFALSGALGRAGGLLKLGEADREAALFWIGSAVFHRSGQTGRAAFLRYGGGRYHVHVRTA